MHAAALLGAHGALNRLASGCIAAGHKGAERGMPTGRESGTAAKPRHWCADGINVPRVITVIVGFFR